MTTNQTVLKWLDEMKSLLSPDQVVWIDGSEEQLETIRKERSDEQGNELWFPMMIGYFNDCPYAKARGLKGEEDLIRHFVHRQDLELRICKEIFPEKSVIIESKNYREEDIAF